MTDRVPGAPGQYKAAVALEEFDRLQAGEQFSITIQRDDQPIVEGTPYSKEAVLPDALAQQLCPDADDPTPADALWALHRRIYPVGSVYISVLDTDPASLFGGTWERLKDRFLLAAGESYEAGATGGEAEHTLTLPEIPMHKHDGIIGNDAYNAIWSNNLDTTGGTQKGVYLTTSNNGTTNLETGNATQNSVYAQNEPHNNMPPYLAVYMWKRVA